MHVVIAGGGIGGLTAALCLHRVGIEVTVCEAVTDPRPLGLGINLQPNAVRVLTALGLGDELAARAIETRELIYMNRHGQEIWRDARGRFAGLPWPQYSVHRGELQMILLQEAVRRLGPGRVRLGRRLMTFTQDDGAARAVFFDPHANPAETLAGDVLVGADGIHSAVRAHFFPGEGAPKWNGIIMWRGATVGAPILSGASMIWAGHSAQKFVCYPISRPLAERGQALLNWICDLRVNDTTMLRPEDWNRPGRLEDFLPRFEAWRLPFLDVPAIIRNAERVHEFPMVDRDPLPAWSRGRVTLLGDAAHPMYPIGSNGASQAILDAEALTEELTRGGPVAAALQRYDARRLPVTAAIVASNRRQGIDVLLDIVEQRAPDGFSDREAVLPTAELETIVADYKRVAQQDKEMLLRLAR
jgi:2-polyprenyl-6-methoxyphenol hydroxylase-like FAD-dependent oxidoreductase